MSLCRTWLFYTPPSSLNAIAQLVGAARNLRYLYEHMRRVGLISDTHGYLDPRLLDLFADVDEVWHAGDIGSLDVLEALRGFKPLRAVWGNADGADVRHAVDPRPRFVFDADDPSASARAAEEARLGMLRFEVEGVSVLMTHIGGYPGRYSPKVLAQMRECPPRLMVAGHSHILRIIYDKKYACLHLNPGACGHYGIHTVRTALKFVIDGGKVMDMQILELSGS